MARQEIPTDVIGTSHLVRELTNQNFEECFPITTIVTKTVGSGKDFATFDEAMQWAKARKTVGDGQIWLALDDGTHYASNTSYNGSEDCYYSITSRIWIYSASGSRANCKITLPADGYDWPVLFNVIDGGYLTLDDVTVDLTVGGLAVVWASILSVVRAGARLLNADLKAGDNVIFIGTGATLYAGQSSRVTTATGAAKKALFCNTGGYAKLDQLNIFAAGVGITIDDGARVVYESAGAVTFGGGTVTTQLNVTVNKIQYHGGYISNGAAALSFQA